MGEVYRAKNTRLHRVVAIKVLTTGLLAHVGSRHRLRKEALALAKVSHSHIAIIYDVGAEAGVDYLVMECVPGQSLAERLKSGVLSEKEVASLGAQIADALEEAHEQGVIHRDLKLCQYHDHSEGSGEGAGLRSSQSCCSRQVTQRQRQQRASPKGTQYLAPYLIWLLSSSLAV